MMHIVWLVRRNGARRWAVIIGVACALALLALWQGLWVQGALGYTRSAMPELGQDLSASEMTVSRTGGPDAQGYLWREVALDWMEISATGMVATEVSNCNDCCQTVPIGFEFDFYGEGKSEVSISANGFLTFDAEDCAGHHISQSPVVNPDAPNDAIYGFWSDFDPTLGGSIYYATEGTPGHRLFIVEYQDVRNYWDRPNHTASMTMEIVLDEATNDILVQFLSVSDSAENAGQYDGARASVGIEQSRHGSSPTASSEEESLVAIGETPESPATACRLDEYWLRQLERGRGRLSVPSMCEDEVRTRGEESWQEPQPGCRRDGENVTIRPEQSQDGPGPMYVCRDDDLKGTEDRDRQPPPPACRCDDGEVVGIVERSYGAPAPCRCDEEEPLSAEQVSGGAGLTYGSGEDDLARSGVAVLFEPGCTWNKEVWINSDGPYAPEEGPFTVSLSDTVTISESLSCSFDYEWWLYENWKPAALELVEYLPTAGDVVTGTGWLYWGGGVPELVPGGTEVQLLKSFQVTEDPNLWKATGLDEFVRFDPFRTYMWKPVVLLGDPAFEPECLWDKDVWINEDGPYAPEDGPFEAAIGDSVHVEDNLWCNFQYDWSLWEGWDTDYLSLEGYEQTHGDVSIFEYPEWHWTDMYWDTDYGYSGYVPPETSVSLSKDFQVRGFGWWSRRAKLYESVSYSPGGVVYGASRPVVLLGPERECLWDKEVWINTDGPYAPEDGPFTVSLSDTITISETLSCNFAYEWYLREEWKSAALELSEYALIGGEVITQTGRLDWSGGDPDRIPGDTEVQLVKSFHVKEDPNEWKGTAIYESVSFDPGSTRLEKPVLLVGESGFEPECLWDKDIWINGDGPYTPWDGPFTVVVSDSVHIEDNLSCNFQYDWTLWEGWDSDYLSLEGYEQSHGAVSIFEYPEWRWAELQWDTDYSWVPPETSVSLSKDFHVTKLGCWNAFYEIFESVSFSPRGMFDSMGGPVMLQPPEPECLWDKQIWINEDGPYAPEEGPFVVSINDTVTISEALSCDSNYGWYLQEEWKPAALELVENLATDGYVYAYAEGGWLQWYSDHPGCVPGDTEVQLEKSFQVKEDPDEWKATIIYESLSFHPGPTWVEKPVILVSEPGFEPECLWDKDIWIRGEGPYAPEDGPFTVVVSDTVHIEDNLWCNFRYDWTLSENWDRDYLSLEGYEQSRGVVSVFEYPWSSHETLQWDSDYWDYWVPPETSLSLSKDYQVVDSGRWRGRVWEGVRFSPSGFVDWIWKDVNLQGGLTAYVPLVMKNY